MKSQNGFLFFKFSSFKFAGVE